MKVHSASQVLFGTFPFRTHVSFFHISCYSPIILVSTSSSYFAFAVPMREVYCAGYTPHAWDPRSLYIGHVKWSLVFWSFWIMRKRWVSTALN